MPPTATRTKMRTADTVCSTRTIRFRSGLLLLLAFAPPVSAVTFEEIFEFTQSDAAANDAFGFSYAIDGDTAILGAHRDDDAGGSSGSGYIFVRNSQGLPCQETLSVDAWCQQAKLTASDAEFGEWFGNPHGF